MKYYQQGDVILKPVKKVEGKKMKTNTVQEGEHTGHAHRFNLDQNATVFQTEDNKRFVSIKNELSLLTHEEHDTQVIEEGDYEVQIVREVDIFSKLVRNVVD